MLLLDVEHLCIRLVIICGCKRHSMPNPTQLNPWGCSSHVEQEDQSLLRQLEGVAEEALGGRNWMAKLDSDLLDNLGRYRHAFAAELNSYKCGRTFCRRALLLAQPFPVTHST